MVAADGQWPIDVPALALAQAAISEKLPPPTRAAALMALLGIVLLGMLIVAIILLGGHWVRRQGAVRRGSLVPPDRAPLHRHANCAENHGAAPSNGDGAEKLRDTQTDYGETRSP